MRWRQAFMLEVCGHLILFNPQKFRTADEKILRLETGQEHEGLPGDGA